jgi:hypothetical protein
VLQALPPRAGGGARPGVRAAMRARVARRGSPERARAGREDLPRDRGEHELDLPGGARLAACGDPAALFRHRGGGLEKVAEYAKRHPIVLVPSHRSYFDFLIVSLLFYQNHLMPPHIAARENMAFGPFGFLFRRAGAFFLRRSFDDPLYKEVLPRLRGLPGARGLHAGVLHRGRPLAHRQDPGAALGHALLERRGFLDSVAAATCSSCRSRSPTSAWSRRGRWSTSRRAAAKRDESTCGRWCARARCCAGASAACS